MFDTFIGHWIHYQRGPCGWKKVSLKVLVMLPWTSTSLLIGKLYYVTFNSNVRVMQCDDLGPVSWLDKYSMTDKFFLEILKRT